MPVPKRFDFPNCSYLWLLYTQFFPPKPSFTEANMPSLHGKVFIVTGGNSGIGEQLTRILYEAGGTVYIMTRDTDKSIRVIDDILATSKFKDLGRIQSVYLDLADLSTVANAVKTFLDNESRLDVLFNNAGVGGVPTERRTAQGLESHFGINVVGHFVLTKLLWPTLAATTQMESVPRNSVRVIWTASIMVEMMAPEGGIDLSQLDKWSPNRNEHYSASKAGAWFLAYEFHRRFGASSGVVSIAQNPGSLRTNVWRNAHFYEYAFLWPFFGRAVDGAHTNLWCGLSPEVTIEDGGKYAIPWGRWHPGQRSDIVRGLKGKDEGGTGVAQEFWDWCEKTVRVHQKLGGELHR